MAKRPRYTDEFRASAVLMWEANPNFVQVAKHLKMPESTLRSWVNRHKQLDKQPSRSDLDVELYDKTKIDFVAMIDGEIAAIFDEMGYKRPDASYRDLGIVYGVLQDKRQLLTGGPTANENRRIVLAWDNA